MRRRGCCALNPRRLRGTAPAAAANKKAQRPRVRGTVPRQRRPKGAKRVTRSDAADMDVEADDAREESGGSDEEASDDEVRGVAGPRAVHKVVDL